LFDAVRLYVADFLARRGRRDQAEAYVKGTTVCNEGATPPPFSIRTSVGSYIFIANPSPYV